jgi:hypothetical protein
MTTLRAILIDPFTKTIAEVPFPASDDYEEINRMIDSDTFTVLNLNSAGDTMYLDDTGHFTPNNEQAFFWWRGYPSMLAGKALILGTDREGDSISTTLDVEYVTEQIVWQSQTTAPLLKPKLTPTIYRIEDDGRLTVVSE